MLVKVLQRKYAREGDNLHLGQDLLTSIRRALLLRGGFDLTDDRPFLGFVVVSPREGYLAPGVIQGANQGPTAPEGL